MMLLIPALHMMGQFYGTQTSKFLLMETAKPSRDSEPPHCEWLYSPLWGTCCAEAQFDICGSSRSFYRNYSFYSSSVLPQRAHRIKFCFPCHHSSDSRTQLSVNKHNNRPQRMAQLLSLEVQAQPHAHSLSLCRGGSMGLSQHTPVLLGRFKRCWADPQHRQISTPALKECHESTARPLHVVRATVKVIFHAKQVLSKKSSSCSEQFSFSWTDNHLCSRGWVGFSWSPGVYLSLLRTSKMVPRQHARDKNKNKNRKKKNKECTS